MSGSSFDGFAAPHPLAGSLDNLAGPSMSQPPVTPAREEFTCYSQPASPCKNKVAASAKAAGMYKAHSVNENLHR